MPLPPPPPLDLRALRAEQGLTQIDLAAMANVSPSFVRSVEAGYRPRGGDALERIAAALGVSAAALRGEQ